MLPMDGPVCRYSPFAKARDVVLCALLAVAAQIAVEELRPEAKLEERLAVAGTLLLASVFTVVRWRWRRWASADETGLSAGGAQGDPVARLGWNELEELSFDKADLRVRGGGVDISVSSDLEGVLAIRDQVFRHAGRSLYRRLRDRVLAGEALDFPGPESRSEAAWRGLAWGGMFGLPLCVVIGRAHGALGAAAAICVSAFLMGRVGNRSMTVALDRDGLRTRGLSIPWSELVSRPLEDGRLLIEDRAGKPLVLHPDRPNFVILQQLILDRVAGR